MECGAVALAICLSLPDFGPPIETRQLLIGPVRSMAMQYRESGHIWDAGEPMFQFALGSTKHYPKLFRKEKTAFLVMQRGDYTMLATPKNISIVRRWEFGR